jgi:hypothetical protein
LPLAKLILGWKDVRKMNASESQFSLTRGALSTCERAKTPIPISHKHIAIFFLACCPFWFCVQAEDKDMTRYPYRKVDGELFDLTDRFHWDASHAWHEDAVGKPCPAWHILEGKVIQTVSDGILFSRNLAPYDSDWKVVFIKHFPESIQTVDNTYLALYAVPSGRYSYITTQGANKTIYAYDYGTIPNEGAINKLKAKAAERLKKAQEDTQRAQEAAQIVQEMQQREIANRRAAQRVAVQQKVLNFYQSPADAGDGFAQLRLGEIYFHGEGGKTNFVLAQKWLSRAVTNGHPEATNLLNQLERSVGNNR